MTSSTTDLSVVLPVYYKDTAPQLKTAIESILAQTLPAREIIIILDGPVMQDVDELILSHESSPIIRIIRLKHNRGLSYALNTAIKATKFPLIARMDADDLALAHRFEKQISLLQEKKLDLVGGQIQEFKVDPEQIISTRTVPTDHRMIVKFMKFRSPFSHPTIIFKKELFEKVGGYNEDQKIEDYDFFVRCYIHNARFGNTADTVLLYRMGEKLNTLSRRRGLAYAKNEIYLYKTFYKNGFYSITDFLKVLFLKVPLRLLPFRLFKFIYITIMR